MNRWLLTLIFLFISAHSFSQQPQLVFKKGNNVLARYWQGTIISFQLKYKVWRKGEITRIQHDSFYIKPFKVTYSMMGADTTFFSIEGHAVSDIYAMPKKGILISYKEGAFQISGTGGHLHFYWIKSGWLFRTGAIGYAGVHTVNGLIKKDLSWQKSKTVYAITAGLFGIGVLMKKLYTPVIQIRKKYKMEILRV